MAAYCKYFAILKLVTFVVTFCHGRFDYDDVDVVGFDSDLPPPLPADLLLSGSHNGRCLPGNQCSFNNANCSSASLTFCPSSVCKCARGYSYDGLGDCLRSVELGQRCRVRTDRCLAENSGCSSAGLCQCLSGYKLGPSGRDCVSAIKTLFIGQRCYDTAQCHGSLRCLSSTCQCPAGFKNSTLYSCIEKTLGDSCLTDSDCANEPNAICRGTRCACARGYKLVNFQHTALSTRPACIALDDDLSQEGASCVAKPSIAGQANSQLCSPPYVCTECELQLSICMSP